MESVYKFERDQIAPRYQLVSEILQDVKDNFTDVSFWVSLAILAENDDQYAQAVQNVESLDFAKQYTELTQNIFNRLTDLDHLSRQIKDNHFQLAQAHDSIEQKMYYNQKTFNENNYNLLLGQSLFPDCFIQKAIDLMPEIQNPSVQRYWSRHSKLEKVALSDYLESQLSDTT